MADLVTIHGPSGRAPKESLVARLGGKDYVFTFRWDSRFSNWLFDVDRYPDARILTGVKLTPGHNLFAQVPGIGTLKVSAYPDTLTHFADGRNVLWWLP